MALRTSQGISSAGASEALKRAEAIFETKSVADIRGIEARTNKEIELKGNQLRSLVGDSYREMVDCADKIVAISDNCSKILGNVACLQVRSDSFKELLYVLLAWRYSATAHADLLLLLPRCTLQFTIPAFKVMGGG